MSNSNQCYRCGRDFVGCPLQNGDGERCAHFVPPRDNSNMFVGFFSPQGRYGRQQFLIAMLIAVAVYVIAIGIAFFIGFTSAMAGVDSMGTIVGFSIITAAVPTYILIVAGIKRTHDMGVPWYWSLLVVLPFWWFNLITGLLGAFCLVYLIKDKGMEGVNQYGANPVEPYATQLEFEE